MIRQHQKYYQKRKCRNNYEKEKETKNNWKTLLLKWKRFKN